MTSRFLKGPFCKLVSKEWKGSSFQRDVRSTNLDSTGKQVGEVIWWAEQILVTSLLPTTDERMMDDMQTGRYEIDLALVNGCLRRKK